MELMVKPSAATNKTNGEGVAIKKVTNVFSKKILAKRALREIKLLQHFRGHRNVGLSYIVAFAGDTSTSRTDGLIPDNMSVRHGHSAAG